MEKTKKNEPEMTETAAKEPRTRVAWTDEEDVILLATLTDQKLAGNQSDSGWKGTVWPVCTNDLKGKGFLDKTPVKCEQHFANVSAAFFLIPSKLTSFQLKDKFKSCQKARSFSGFGWHPKKKVIVCTDETDWERLIKVCAYLYENHCSNLFEYVIFTARQETKGLEDEAFPFV